MDQTVYIPFQKKLDPGNASFTLTVDPNYSKRQFGFGTMTLIPDLYSIQASNLELEDDVHRAIKESVMFQLYYKTHVFKAYEPFATTPMTTPQVLQYLNNYFEDNKVPGALLPPFIFDWVHVDAIHLNKIEQFVFNYEHCEEYYGESFIPPKHGGFLRDDVRSLDIGFNNFKYPTNPAVWKNIRIRKTVMANAFLNYSNNHLLRSLGFDEEYTMGSEPDRSFSYTFSKMEGFWTVVAKNPPREDAFVSETRIKRVGPYHLFQQSKPYVLETTTKNKRNPETLINDFKHVLLKASIDINVNLRLEFDETSKRYMFTFPKSQYLNVVIQVSPQLAYTLGFGHVTQITREMTSVSQPGNISLKDVSRIAKIQTLDTGMVLVNVVQHGSMQTSQFTNSLMAVLQPQSGRYLTTKFNVPGSWITVPRFNPRLEFVLSTFNENNTPVPLEWRHGASIRGVLIGHV
jgi:hypothetical protein